MIVYDHNQCVMNGWAVCYCSDFGVVHAGWFFEASELSSKSRILIPTVQENKH